MTGILRQWWLAALLLTLAGGGCATSSLPQKQTDGPYDPVADAERSFPAVLSRAQREQKRVLLNLGANWCSDSRAMSHLLLEDASIRHEIASHFIYALVDVNLREGPPRNEALVQRFGRPLGRGIPVLLVLDANGNLLNTDPAERLSDDAHKRPGEVLAYLQKWAND